MLAVLALAVPFLIASAGSTEPERARAPLGQCYIAAWTGACTCGAPHAAPASLERLRALTPATEADATLSRARRQCGL